MSNAHALTPSPLLDAVNAAQALVADIDKQFMERRSEATLMVTALIAGEHVCLLGPPGTGKSALTNCFANAIDYSAVSNGSQAYWSYLFGRFTQPDEVFGPVSLPALEKEINRRVTTGKMPEARIAFLDEGFKANSAILNNLLTILNERWFDNPTRTSVPLEMCVIASNELPEGGALGELGALYDRFLVRRWVQPIRNRDNLRRLLLGGSKPALTASITAAQLADLRAAREAVTLDGVIDLILDLKDWLEQEVGIATSDRRWGKALKLVQAHAVLNGRTYADTKDLIVLADCLWDEPDQRAPIAGAVAKVADVNLAEALELRDSALEAFARCQFGDDIDDAVAAGANNPVARALTDILARMRRLPESSDIAELIAEVDGMQNAIAADQRRRMGW